MTDQKLSAITASTTAPADTDLFYTVEDVGSTPISKSKAWSTLKTAIQSLITGTKLDDFTAPDDNTDLNVSASAHGLCPKFPNNTTTFLRGDGTYATPSGITVLDHVTTDASTAANSSENNLWSYTLPGGTLGTSGAVYFKAYILTGSGNGVITIKFYYGATSCTIFVTPSGTYGPVNCLVEAVIIAKGATNSQRLSGNYAFGGFGSAFSGTGTTATAAIDSTTDQTVKLTYQHSASGAGTIYSAMLTYVGAV